MTKPNQCQGCLRVFRNERGLRIHQSGKYAQKICRRPAQ